MNPPPLRVAWLFAAALSAGAPHARGQDPAPAPGIKETLRPLIAAVDPARIEQTIRKLVGFGTRHVLSRTDSDTEGTGAARKWLRAEYESIAAQSGGRLTVALQEAAVACTRPGMPKEVPVVNVIATLRGTTDPDRIYVVGGHYDSINRSGADGKGIAPGACDDASGTAVALEACRVMAQRPFAATILFVAYDGEEQGLLGSKAHADALAKADAKVDGMIGCDIVGNTLGMDGKRYDGWLRCFSYSPTGNDSMGRSMARAVTFSARQHVEGFAVKLVFRGDRYGRGGDHRSFFEQGFPCVRFTEPREDFSRQHQDLTERDGKPYGDIPEYVDFGYSAKVARVVVATLGELASAPPVPRVISAELLRDRYDTRITFELPAGVQDYEFVFRETTEPDWTGALSRAQVRSQRDRAGREQAILPGVCLDDAVVGMRSIGADGSRSRVAVPPEPDRFNQRRTGEAARGSTSGGGDR